MITKEMARQMISEFQKLSDAQIYEADVLSPFTLQKYTLDLSVAKSSDSPFEISFPFRTIAFKNATGGSGQVTVKFNKNDSGLSSFTFDNNDVLNSDKIFDKAFLSWAAQAGKTIDVYIFVNSKFNSGSLINSGSIAVAPSSTFSGTSVNTTAVTNTLVIAANTLRKRVTITNLSLGYCYIQGTVGGTTVGYYLQSSESKVFDTTAALYSYSEQTSTGGLKVAEET